MLLTKEVELVINGNNISILKENGYEIPKSKDKWGKTRVPKGTTIMVKVEHLKEGSHAGVEVLCDYCKETIVKKEYRNYIRDNAKSVVKTDCCAKCQPIKTKECNMINIGVESHMHLEEHKEKHKQRMIDTYGFDHNMKVPEIKQKAIDTFIKNYGCENPMQNQDIIDKSNATKIKHFGTTSIALIPSIRAKTIQTNLRKYGVEWQMQSKEIMEKSKITMYKNGSVPCSNQQRYLHKLLGGELNYPVSRLSLDIAFPEDKIYIEYGGNGHELSVRMGTISKKDFDIKEIRRYQYLKSNGWKIIKITSYYDYLPSDEVIIEEYNKAIEWFESDDYGHWHYNVNIGNKKIDDTYGQLRRITEKDLE